MSKSEKFRYLMLVLPVLLVFIAVGAIVAASAGGPLGASADNTTASTVYANINITPGSDPSQLCFSWETTSALIPAESTEPIPAVQIARASAMTGGVFPESRATTFYGQSIEAYVNPASAGTFSVPITPTATVFAGWYQNKVTATGLKPNTSYVYRYGNGTESNWSTVYSIKTGNPNSYSFLAMGDPQLGACLEPTGPRTLAADTEGWQNTMADAGKLFPNDSFMLSVGDEVNNTSSQQSQDNEYAAYFSASQMQDLPIANVDGNHDYYMGPYYGYHYDFPNQSAQYGATQWGNDGDFWFTYGNALFMVLNSNTLDVATHDAFIGQAIAANPNAKWRIVSFHHSLYCEADGNNADIEWRRLTYPSVFDKYKIDVVLSGHDHTYNRSYQMLGGVPQKKQTYYNGSVLHPTGTVYFTLDSGSGDKFNQFAGVPEAYTAFRWQQNVATFSQVSISDSQFSIVVYRTDNNQIVDKYSIVK
jgi:hypothetical protein